ncbi:glycoside hydrolase [Aspergillus steynii IBT 23096]|uniref:Alpha-glucosidase n=1 Tax=Aspergillus steynii IBT 23096 TaxID=1392250 RepID=A0A2I2GLX2_9EURO|nr:glycoside hydrolase [Aspergillus steynii IBT 23096]PLB53877.1 glycoside hydrolase [Aspergillus steynii IBT 23096]
MAPAPIDQKWWKNAIIYQIYPASFKDSNNDGIGDIPGIISSLDYITSLGVDVVWLSPMYDSPQHDMGYDVADYESVYPPYGTVQDMQVLIDECHRRGLRIILDLVVNHTSDQHAWFKESRSSKSNPKRDWYIWRPAKYAADGTRRPPNNWRSIFGGSAWEWDETTQEYYLHLFVKEQPDVNWENPDARRAIYDSAMEFWLQKGVDGFRVDTVNMYSKQPGLPDAPVLDPKSETQVAASLFCNGPRIHEYLGEMNAILNKYDAMTVGELPNTHTLDGVLAYVSAAQNQLSMVFQFDIVDLGMGKDYKYLTTLPGWTLPELKGAIKGTQDIIDGTDGWTTVFMENHDQGRSVSRFGSDKTPELRVRSAKMLSLMQCTLSGTQFVYQGQEIGMVNAPEHWSIEEYKDIDSINFYNMVRGKTNNDPVQLENAMKALQRLARDHARLPLQWSAEPNGGFSPTASAKTWMRVHDNVSELNVQKQEQDSASVLSFWKSAMRLRKKYADVFVFGTFELLDEGNEKTFTYLKKSQDRTVLLVLNFSEEGQKFEKPATLEGQELSLLFGNVDNRSGDELLPFEGRAYLVNKA